MKNRTYVEDVLVAINSVKSRLNQAHNLGQDMKAFSLMADLAALDACLVIETKKLLQELYDMENNNNKDAA